MAILSFTSEYKCFSFRAFYARELSVFSLLTKSATHSVGFFRLISVGPISSGRYVPVITDELFW